jgi:hypothetical protein
MKPNSRTVAGSGTIKPLGLYAKLLISTRLLPAFDPCHRWVRSGVPAFKLANCEYGISIIGVVISSIKS